MSDFRGLRRSIVVLALLAALGWTWAVTLMMRGVEEQTAYQTIVREVPAEIVPYELAVDARLDLDELDRQAECMWLFMRAEGIEITLENVFVVGDYTDIRGGACLLIGED